jgi:glutamine amidotransferase
MAKTITKLGRWSGQVQGSASQFNFAITDGHSIVASRYVSDDSAEPQTLYVAEGHRFEIREGHYRMAKGGDRTEAVIIASEPLTDVAEDWDLVPRNHLVTVSPELHVRVQPL